MGSSPICDTARSVIGKYRRTSESKQLAVSEIFGDSLVSFAKLAAVAFVEDKYDFFIFVSFHIQKVLRVAHGII